MMAAQSTGESMPSTAPSTAKIFGIGFQKTGTSSLNEALRLLGYRAAGGFRINHPKGVALPPPLTNEKVLPLALARAREADAFNDNPWPPLFRELDAAFPDAKFILTLRDADRWMASVLRHFGDTRSDVAQWIYGVPCPKGHEARYRAVYEAHNDAVRAHFADRPDALLQIDFEQGAGWRELCGFLGVQVPASAFPHDNRAEDRERRQRTPWRRLKAALSGGRVP